MSTSPLPSSTSAEVLCRMISSVAVMARDVGGEVEFVESVAVAVVCVVVVVGVVVVEGVVVLTVVVSQFRRKFSLPYAFLLWKQALHVTSCVSMQGVRS